jgi:hypothetical protein
VGVGMGMLSQAFDLTYVRTMLTMQERILAVD